MAMLRSFPETELPVGGASSETRYIPVPDAGVSWSTDIIELIMADHRRIGRLRDALYDTARYRGDPGPDRTIGHVWQRLADLLVAHTQAAEKICYLPMFRTAAQVTGQMRDSVADHDDIRRLIGKAAMRPVRSAPWWHAVSNVLAVSAEYLEREERGVLPGCLLGLSMSQRKESGRQWCAFWRHGGGTPPSGS
jgi:hypothetical protein